jgi:hypothetical protein
MPTFMTLSIVLMLISSYNAEFISAKSDWTISRGSVSSAKLTAGKSSV